MKTQGLVFLFVLALSQSASARWSWSLGYNNPPGSQLGLNFMNLWSNWAFEVGIGGIQQSTGTDSGGNETKSTSVLGDVNFKYLGGSGTVRPYLEFGAGSGATVTTASGGNLSAGVGGLFGGTGLYAMGTTLNFYLGIVTGGGNGSLQFGIGTNF